MSLFKEITPIFSINEKENISSSNAQSYNDLIDYCSIRKQFSRIIPNNYINIQKEVLVKKPKYYPRKDELKKLRKEILSTLESINILRESKEKKLKQINELRCLMRRIGSKKSAYNESDKNSKETKGINININHSSNKLEEGFSVNLSSRLSSGKHINDECKEEGYQGSEKYDFNNYSNNHSKDKSHFGFFNVDLDKIVMLGENAKKESIPLNSN